jgi:hypothetical protein
MSCGLKARRGAPQIRLDLIEVGVRILGSQELLGPNLGLFRPTHVNFRSPFRNLSQNDDPIRQNLEEAFGAKEIFAAVAYPAANFPNTQFAEQGSMAGKDSEVAPGRRNGYLIHLTAEEPLLGRYDFELYLIGQSHIN